MSEPFDEQPDGDPHGECAAEIHRLEARITELEERLEIGTGPYDGIAARDETIRLLEAENARLRVDAGQLWKALNDLSFECDGVVGTVKPTVETYNRTFGVMDSMREKYAAMQSHSANTGLRTRDGERILRLPGANILIVGSDGCELVSIYSGSHTRYLNCFEESFVLAALDYSANTVGGPTPVMDAAPACERNQVIKECAAICAKFVRLWNETSLDRYNAGRTQDSLLWDGKAMGAGLCHDTIMGLAANCSNADTRTAGESDS